MRLRYLAVVLLTLAALVGKRLLYSDVSAPRVSVSAPALQSYLVILGIGDNAGTSWDGSITATGATILSLTGWRFSGTDSISGTSGWKLATREAPPPPLHRNVLFAQRGIRPLPRLPISPDSPSLPAPDTNMLYAYLKSVNSGITAAHTSATDQGTDWRNNDPLVEPFVEIYQGSCQNYEMPGAPRSNSPQDALKGFEAAGYVANALAKGYQLAFEASSDHVSTHISYTNVWVTERTRAGILDALRKRRLYGSTDSIVADFRSGTHYMGESFTTSSPPVFTVRMWGTAPFQSVVVVKDNNVVYSTSGDRVVSFTWQDANAQKGKTSYYYVRGLQQAEPGQVTGQIVWVSPMWVTLADVGHPGVI